MASPGITIGLELGAMPPPALNRALVYFARLSGLKSVWILDHFQGLIPSAIWDQQFSWAAAQNESPHELFDYQTLMGYLASTGHTDPASLKTAMAYGTVVASFNVEDFSLRRLLRTDRDQINQRLESYRSMMAF